VSDVLACLAVTVIPGTMPPDGSRTTMLNHVFLQASAGLVSLAMGLSAMCNDLFS
jgi:hypothetical protein